MFNILIVEDDQTIRRLLTKSLKSWGYAVTSAGNGKLALQLIEQGLGADLVILDFNLPCMKGTELLAHVKDLPVILMTGLDRITAEQKARHHPRLCLLLKPFRLGDLREKVRSMLSAA
jgi:CheY-like chemotaxis protein